MFKKFKSYTFEIDECTQTLESQFISFKAEEILKKEFSDDFSDVQFSRFSDELLKVYKESLRDGVLFITVKENSLNKKMIGKIELSEPLDHQKAEKLIALILSTYLKDFDFSCINISAPENYWDNIIETLQADEDIVSRLVIILKGFYLEDCLLANKNPSYDGLIDFWDSKRPYGSKDIPASILYTLGLDHGRVLCWDRKDIPKKLIDMCEKWHEDVLIRLKSDT